MSVENNFYNITEQISTAVKKSGRRSQDVKLLAVSKTFSAENVREAHALGIHNFAENYVQEFMQKKSELTDLDIIWHFIGHIQSNKVKQLVGQSALLQSVDRGKILTEIEKHAQNVEQILIEVNLVGEKSKSGVSPKELPSLIEDLQMLNKIKLRGLMFMAPLDLSLREQHQFYGQAQSLLVSSKKYVNSPHALVELSMGTSHDFTIAIEHGATIVRLGTALFGERSL